MYFGVASLCSGCIKAGTQQRYLSVFKIPMCCAYCKWHKGKAPVWPLMLLFLKGIWTLYFSPGVCPKFEILPLFPVSSRVIITDYPTSNYSQQWIHQYHSRTTEIYGVLQTGGRIKLKKACKEKLSLIWSKKKKKQTKLGINYVLWTANGAVGLQSQVAANFST